MSSPLFEIRDVSFRAGGQSILTDVSWQVDAGQHWAMIGPNGAGKTTLLKIACGYIWPNDGGEILRQGKRLVDLRQLRRSMGWVSHRFAAEIPTNEPVLDTVLSGRRGEVGLKHWQHASNSPIEEQNEARQYLEKLGCSHLTNRPFGVLSQGEQQKVLIARSLMSLPLLVFLNEPCAGLDPGVRERFLADLQDLAERSSLPSLILVTHHIEEITPALENLLIVHDGRITHCGKVHEIINVDLLQQLYGVPVNDLVRQDGRYWPVLGDR